MKSKVAAGLLAIFLGELGIHAFYLGQTTKGIVYLLLFLFLSWTVIVPIIMCIVTIIEGIILLCQDENDFNLKYNYSR